MVVAEFVTARDSHSGRVLSWASLLDENVQVQAEMISRAPVVDGHVALMPDAHLGLGACVGSAIKTRGGILPSAVGVYIGCGMRAVQTDVRAEGLSRERRGEILARFRQWIPAGVGQGRETGSPLDRTYRAWLDFERDYGHAPGADDRIRFKAIVQFGTLGSGNHFAETGGVLMHCAIVTREYAIPCVVGVGPVDGRIEDGDTITVDGNQGIVRVD